MFPKLVFCNAYTRINARFSCEVFTVLHVYWLNGRPLYLWHFSTLRSGRYIANIGFIAFHPLRHRCSQGSTFALGTFSGLVLWLLLVRRLQAGHVEIVVFQLHCKH
jgi:hypothetical protein